MTTSIGVERPSDLDSALVRCVIGDCDHHTVMEVGFELGFKDDDVLHMSYGNVSRLQVNSKGEVVWAADVHIEIFDRYYHAQAISSDLTTSGRQCAVETAATAVFCQAIAATA